MRGFWVPLGLLLWQAQACQFQSSGDSKNRGHFEMEKVLLIVSQKIVQEYEGIVYISWSV